MQSSQESDPRHLARRLAIQFLHQLAVQNGENIDQIDVFLTEFSTDERACPLARQWIKGAWQNLGSIDCLISEVSSNWKLNRMNLVDRNNLRLAVYQLQYCHEIPAKVVINEAIELAKLFSTAAAPGFINGILDVIYHKIKEKNHT